MPPSVAPFSAAVVAGDICFISGQPATDPESGQSCGGTVEQEFVVAFGNVLAIADYAAVNEVYRRALRARSRRGV